MRLEAPKLVVKMAFSLVKRCVFPQIWGRPKLGGDWGNPIVRIPFSTLVKDLISLALTEKKGALEGLFILPRLILPNNNMRGRTVVSKVL